MQSNHQSKPLITDYSRKVTIQDLQPVDYSSLDRSSQVLMATLTGYENWLVRVVSDTQSLSRQTSADRSMVEPDLSKLMWNREIVDQWHAYNAALSINTKAYELMESKKRDIENCSRH